MEISVTNLLNKYIDFLNTKQLIFDDKEVTEKAAELALKAVKSFLCIAEYQRFCKKCNK